MEMKKNRNGNRNNRGKLQQQNLQKMEKIISDMEDIIQ